MVDAVPTIFHVPNPPPQLSSSRPAPKRRRVDPQPDAVATDAVVKNLLSPSSSMTKPSFTPRSDHSYCSLRDLEDSVSDSLSGNTDTVTPSAGTAGRSSRVSGRRKIFNSNDPKLRKII